MQFLKSSLDKHDLRDYLMIIVGTLIYGFGFNGFILSNEIITGGLSGLCALIYFATGQMIPVSVSYFVINILLLAIALKILGLKFLIKKLFSEFSRFPHHLLCLRIYSLNLLSRMSRLCVSSLVVCFADKSGTYICIKRKYGWY